MNFKLAMKWLVWLQLVGDEGCEVVVMYGNTVKYVQVVVLRRIAVAGECGGSISCSQGGCFEDGVAANEMFAAC